MFSPAVSFYDTPTAASCNLQSAYGALPCDAWHPYYHYQASAQYLWLGAALCAQARMEEAQEAYNRAIFQDHTNQEALQRRKTSARHTVLLSPDYTKHAALDALFLTSIGKQEGPATAVHDEAVALMPQDGDTALALLARAIAIDPAHGNSFFTRGQCHFHRKEYALAVEDFKEALRISQQEHDAYHRAASAQHVARGQRFMTQEAWDLAVNSLTKALDLDKANAPARRLRAQSYRAKGAIALAQADEGLCGP